MFNPSKVRYNHGGGGETAPSSPICGQGGTRMLRLDRSKALYQEALDCIVGGVNSPSRSFYAVGGGTPVFIERAQGAYLYDVDGNRYIDYLAAYGPLILGHAHPTVTAAIVRAAAGSVLYGTPHPGEAAMAAALRQAIPSLELVRFVNSGTEAVMSALRVARAATGRTKFVKFSGCYHGHFDAVLVKAGSGPSSMGQPDSAGIPPGVTQDVITVPFGNAAALAEALQAWPGQVAAVMVEPIVGNFGIVMPPDGFLEQVRELTHAHGALLIFDEVITNFRFCYGGAQNLLGVEPDITCLGKIIGGGLPIGAYGGRRAVMEQVAPLGPAYQAGTMAGNPLSLSAGMATLEVLRQPGTYERLEEMSAYLAGGLLELASRHRVPVSLNRVGSGFTVYFGSETIVDYDGAVRSDKAQFARFFQLLLERGVHLAPSRFEAWFLSTAHTRADLDATLAAADEAFAIMVHEK